MQPRLFLMWAALLTICLGAGTIAIVKLNGQAQPALSLPDGDVFTFDYILQGELGSHAFRVRNDGTKALQISAKSSCACTVTNAPTPEAVEGGKPALSVEPGGSAEVTAQWSTNNKVGSFAQRVVLFTNDPKKPKVELGIVGKVTPAIVTDLPNDTVVIGREGEGGRPEDVYSFKVWSPIDQNWELSPNMIFDKRMFAVTVEPSAPTSDGQRGYQVHIQVIKTAPVGDVNERLLLGTTHPRRPELKVLLTGEVAGPFRVKPKTITFTLPSRMSTAESTLQVEVLSTGRPSFRLASAPVGITIVDQKLVTMDRGSGTYNVSMVYDASVGSGRTGIVLAHEKMILETGLAEQPPISVPVSVYSGQR
jgi:hypothetical protein